MIAVLDSVASTQDEARARLAASPSTQRAWVRARHQSAGRGRMGRRWDSEDAPASGRENLLLSCAFRTRGEALPWPFVSLLAGAALHACVAEAWCRPLAELALKWPNDLVWDEPGASLRKLGGVLAELQHGVLCVGWGLNLHSAPPLAHARAWAAIDPEGLARLSRTPGGGAATTLAEALRRRFESLLDAWWADPAGLAALLSRQLNEGAMACLKDRVGVLPESGLKARVLGLLPDGRLQVEALEGPQNGRRLVLGSGEIALGYGP